MQTRAVSLVLMSLALVVGCGGGDSAAVEPAPAGDQRTAPSSEPSSEPADSPRTNAAPALVQPAQPTRTAQPAQPPRADQPEVTAEPEPTDEFADWATYRHPLGGEFRHPSDWRISEAATGLLLVPPDLATDRELIAVFSSPAQGVTDPKDARVGQTLDAMMMQTVPGLRRSGTPKSVATRAAAGASFDYRGKAPDGRSARCRVFVAIKDDVAVSFSVLGDTEAFRARAPIVERIFSSLSDGREAGGDGGRRSETSSQIDPKLVGVFQGESIARSSGVYINTQLVYALNADGSVLYGAQSHMNASQRDASGNLKWTADGQSGGNVEKGRWSARSGFLTIQWESGASSRVAYGFEPDGTLALRNALTRELINIYSRVR